MRNPDRRTYSGVACRFVVHDSVIDNDERVPAFVVSAYNERVHFSLPSAA
jgi:hypothetical protein